MTKWNRYAQQDADDNTSTLKAMRRLANGQHLILAALLLWLATFAIPRAVDPLPVVAAITAVFLSLIGLYQIASGLDFSLPGKVVVFVTLLFPFLSLLTLLILNNMATKELRAAGYKVGLLGARVPKA